MSGVLNTLAVLAFGFLLLILQSALTNVVHAPAFAPNLMLPIVIFLGVSPDVQLLRGALLSFLLGYLLDLFCGNLLSLQTFVLVAIFMLARGAGLRLFLRGPAFQVLLTFLVSLLAGAASVALLAIFEPAPAPIPVRDLLSSASLLLGSATVTALAAPILFVIVRRLDAIGVHRRDEAEAHAP